MDDFFGDLTNEVSGTGYTRGGFNADRCPDAVPLWMSDPTPRPPGVPAHATECAPGLWSWSDGLGVTIMDFT